MNTKRITATQQAAVFTQLYTYSMRKSWIGKYVLTMVKIKHSSPWQLPFIVWSKRYTGVQEIKWKEPAFVQWEAKWKLKQLKTKWRHFDMRCFHSIWAKITPIYSYSRQTVVYYAPIKSVKRSLHVVFSFAHLLPNKLRKQLNTCGYILLWS